MTLMYLSLYQSEHIIAKTFLWRKTHCPEEESRYPRVIMWARLKGLSGVQGQGRGLHVGSVPPQPNCRPSRGMTADPAGGYRGCVLAAIHWRLLCTYVVLSTSRCADLSHLCDKCVRRPAYPAFLRQSSLSLSETDLPTFTDNRGYGWQKPAYGQMCQPHGSVGSNIPPSLF